MIGECASLAPRKNSLNLFNVVMSLLAGIFMIVACASYSANIKTVQNLSFMVQKTVTNGKSGNDDYKTVSCQYVSLQGICTAYCADSQTIDPKTSKVIDMPSDDKLRDCATGSYEVTVKDNAPVVTYSSTLILYKDFVEKKENDCAKTIDVGMKLMCVTFEQCQTGGNTTVAFAIIGCIAALFSMVAFAWRMNSDGVCPKLISIGLATGTFIACTVAFAAFQPCMSSINANAEATYALAKIANPKLDQVISFRPGVGGAMAVTSFVFFIYVMFMSVFVPSAGPAGSEAGLDNKAPQV
jgi:hypothetical protein